jgi:putative tricarboxylic transport membrane protein
MRVLAVSGQEPIDVGATTAKTIKEQGLDVVMTNWRGIVAPPGLSDGERQDVVDFVEKLRATPQWKASLERFGWSELAKSGADFDRFLEDEKQRVRQLVSELKLAS